MRTLVLTLLLAAFGMTALAADATGKWSGSFKTDDGNTNSAFVILKQDGTTITGSGGPDESQQLPIEKGKIEGNMVSGEVTTPEGIVYKLNVKLDGDTLAGDLTATGGGQTLKAKIELTRVKS